MKCFQLTFNAATIFDAYSLEELYNRNECPLDELEDIAQTLMDTLDERFICYFVGLNMEKGGKTGHIHITVYCQLEYQPASMRAWQKMFPEHPHVQFCNGTPKQNMDYLYKRGTDENEKKHDTLRWGPVCVGEMRNLDKVDKKEFVKLIGQGKSYWEIVQEYPDALVEAAYGINKAIESRTNNESNVRREPVQRVGNGGPEGRVYRRLPGEELPFG